MKSTIKIYLYGCILVFLLIGINAMAQESQESLDHQDPVDEYLKIAADNNPELKSTFNQYLATLEKMPQARALPDPTLMFNVFISPVETRVGAQRAGISLNQAFPWFGQLRSQENAVSQLAKARYEAFSDSKNRLFFDVRSTYYDLYVLEAAIRITHQNIDLLKSLGEMANVRLETAKGSAVDLLRVQMDKEELQNQLTYLEESKLPIQAKLSELLNTDSPVDIIVPDTLQTIAIEEGKYVLLDSVLAQNPLLKGLDYEILSLDQEIDVAHKMGLPSFSLGLSYINVSPRTDIVMPENGKDALIFPQVGVRLPIYRGKYNAMVKEKEFQQTAVSLKKENKENELQTSLEETWRDYSDALRRVDLYNRLLRLANQSLDILIAQYTTAGSDFEEILRMDRQLLRYELELEKARSDQNTIVAYINYLTGNAQ